MADEEKIRTHLRKVISDNETGRRFQREPDSDEDEYGDESFLGALLSKNDPVVVRDKKIQKRLAREAAEKKLRDADQDAQESAARIVRLSQMPSTSEDRDTCFLDYIQKQQELRRTRALNEALEAKAKSSKRPLRGQTPVPSFLGRPIPEYTQVNPSVGSTSFFPTDTGSIEADARKKLESQPALGFNETPPRHSFLGGHNIAVLPYTGSDENILSDHVDVKKVTSENQGCSKNNEKLGKHILSSKLSSAKAPPLSLSSSNNKMPDDSRVVSKVVKSLTQAEINLKSSDTVKSSKKVTSISQKPSQQQHESNIMQDLKATIPHYQLPRRRDIFPPEHFDTSMKRESLASYGFRRSQNLVSTVALTSSYASMPSSVIVKDSSLAKRSSIPDSVLNLSNPSSKSIVKPMKKSSELAAEALKKMKTKISTDVSTKIVSAIKIKTKTKKSPILPMISNGENPLLKTILATYSKVNENKGGVSTAAGMRFTSSGAIINASLNNWFDPANPLAPIPTNRESASESVPDFPLTKTKKKVKKKKDDGENLTPGPSSNRSSAPVSFSNITKNTTPTSKKDI